MPDYGALLNTFKQSANEANDANKPVQICFGKVTSASPLQILVDQKMTLDETFLVLARNVTQFTSMVTVQWTSESALTKHKHVVDGVDSDEVDLAHTHDIVGTKQMTFHWGLEVGEEVIMLRMQGGQKYIVLDRIGGG